MSEIMKAYSIAANRVAAVSTDDSGRERKKSDKQQRTPG